MSLSLFSLCPSKNTLFVEYILIFHHVFFFFFYHTQSLGSIIWYTEQKFMTIFLYYHIWKSTKKKIYFFVHSSRSLEKMKKFSHRMHPVVYSPHTTLFSNPVHARTNLNFEIINFILPHGNNKKKKVESPNRF
jgi:hypothetical protein